MSSEFHCVDPCNAALGLSSQFAGIELTCLPEKGSTSQLSTRKAQHQPWDQIEGVDDPKATTFYLGKKIAFVYRARKEIRGTKIRVIWGKVTRPHGNSGVVRAQFRRNLPPKSFGASVRIMLYPSSV
ncbi:MAG: hypothetical protein LQ344_002527 [Seirophora lacunosa]|nr:MAG: hypothetical protein LQ344_002527 [Seirophora lacunosa]